VFSHGILQFMRDLDTPEIHGYLPDFGYRVYTEKAIEMTGASLGLPRNGDRSPATASAPAVQKPSKKKASKRGGFNDDRNLPEVGHTELLGQQHPGDAITADPPPSAQVVPEPGAADLTGG
jgi:arginine decarboxylase